ncbi:tRNA-dihydrouridine synthase 3, partial [Haematococcus lacustris]
MLPVQAAVSVQRAVNLLSKEVQTSLWKHRYNFSRSDEVLNELGLRISFKSTADRQQASAAQPDAKRVKLEPAVVEGSITSDVKLEEGGAAGTGKEGKAEAEDKVAEAEGKVPEAEGKVAEAEGKVPGKVECKEEEMAADEPSTS